MPKKRDTAIEVCKNTGLGSSLNILQQAGQVATYFYDALPQKCKEVFKEKCVSTMSDHKRVNKQELRLVIQSSSHVLRQTEAQSTTIKEEFQKYP